MIEETNDIERIEKYVEGKLSLEETRAFAKELCDNTDLVSEMQAYQKAVKGIRDYGLKAELRTYHQEFFEKLANKRILYWKYISGIAASVIIIIGLVYILLFQSLSNSELFTRYFEPYPDIITTRNVDNSNLAKGLKSYSSGEYEMAITIFNSLPPTDPDYTTALFYMAISYLAITQPQIAIDSLEKLNRIDKTYQEQVHWYLALSYLKLDDTKSAKKQLMKIEEKHFKYIEAQELLDKPNKPYML